MAVNDSSVELIRQLLHYEPDTGRFTRIQRMGNQAAGTDPCSKMLNGYFSVSVKARRYYAHRLAWLLTHGQWPDGQIDHINGDRADNRLANLRVVDGFGNTQNLRRAKRNNKLGLLGVSMHQGRFRAFIHTRGKTRHLGMFDTAQEAHQAYVAAKRETHAANTL